MKAGDMIRGVLDDWAPYQRVTIEGTLYEVRGGLWLGEWPVEALTDITIIKEAEE